MEFRLRLYRDGELRSESVSDDKIYLAAIAAISYDFKHEWHRWRITTVAGCTAPNWEPLPAEEIPGGQSNILPQPGDRVAITNADYEEDGYQGILSIDEGCATVTFADGTGIGVGMVSITTVKPGSDLEIEDKVLHACRTSALRETRRSKHYIAKAAGVTEESAARALASLRHWRLVRKVTEVLYTLTSAGRERVSRETP